MPGLDRQIKRCPPVLVARIAVRALLQQQFDDLGMSIVRRFVQRRPAIQRRQIHLRTARDQVTTSQQMPARGGLHQRSPAKLADCIRIGPFSISALTTLAKPLKAAQCKGV